MKVVLMALVLLVQPLSGITTFRSEVIGVTLEFPLEWELAETEDQKFLVISPATGEWGLSGLPPAPYPWFSVTKTEDRVCPPKTSDTPNFSKGIAKEGKYWEALVCGVGYEIMLGYWERDTSGKDRREELGRILESVSSTR